MWSPSGGLVRVGLSPQGLAIARLPRFGLGLGMGLSLARQAAVEYVACGGAGTGPAGAGAVAGASANAGEPWRAAVDTLAQWLAARKGQRLNVQIVLGGCLARWQLLPWRAELSGPDEQAAYAALRFRETYGRVAQDWQVLPASLPPGNTAPAAAVDRALIDALGQACSQSGAQLQSITPYFSCAFDVWRSALKAPSLWFGTLESGQLTLGLLQAGQWTALQTQRLGADWQAPLAALMAQMALACDVQATWPLYLAGEPAPAGGVAISWLQPQPLSTANTPGLRLVMGC